MAYAEAGMRPPSEHQDLDLPIELAEAMDTDPQLATAFHNLTPGRQRSYVVTLSSAKAAATRIARIAKFRDHILAGKGATEQTLPGTPGSGPASIAPANKRPLPVQSG